MKKNLLIALLIAGFLTVSAAEVMACDKGKSDCMKCAIKKSQCLTSKLKSKVKMLWLSQEDLDISEDQMSKIKDIKHAALKEMIQLKADLDILKVDLMPAFYSEQIDIDTVGPQVEQKYELKKKSALAFTKALSDIQGVLSEKQREEWKDMVIAAKLASKCSSCSGPKICPITGKAIGAKGSTSK